MNDGTVRRTGNENRDRMMARGRSRRRRKKMNMREGVREGKENGGV